MRTAVLIADGNKHLREGPLSGKNLTRSVQLVCHDAVLPKDVPGCEKNNVML